MEIFVRYFELIFWFDLVIFVILNQLKYLGLFVSFCVVLVKEFIVVMLLFFKDLLVGYIFVGIKGDYLNLVVYSNFLV